MRKFVDQTPDYQHSRTRRAAWKDDAPEEISVAQVPPFGGALLPEERSLVVLSCGIDASWRKDAAAPKAVHAAAEAWHLGRAQGAAWPRAGEDPLLVDGLVLDSGQRVVLNCGCGSLQTGRQT